MTLGSTPRPPDSSRFSELSSVERPAIALLAGLGWETVDGYHETYGVGGTLGRDNAGEIVLVERLRPVLERLNPDLPSTAIEAAVEQLTKDRSFLDLVRANQEVHRLLRNGVRVDVRHEDGSRTTEMVTVVDWRDPEANDFLLVSQLWVVGDMYKRRADLVGFVNGIPLVLVELKASQHKLRDAYDDNLTDYRDTIPRIFWPNALIILSNGSESRVGTITAEWEHFATWERISDEREPRRVSLETLLRGTCEKTRLLDLVENFVAFMQRPGRLIKILAKNHQYLGVNNAIARLTGLSTEDRAKLGVYWHTQGSGKTVSMLFFSQKVLRTTPGNWTFVVVTDRNDLDEQAYREFQRAGVVTEENVRATSGTHLKELLTEDHRYVFTLIQKFRIERGATYPKLSGRSDVIVMTDEAHRTQYDTLALNMRNALPNASYIGFTGTPLMTGEEHTRRIFGDYVSVYNFAESVTDRATVPLYYENRIPELQLTNENFAEEFEQILEDAVLDEEQERRLARHFGREYHLITREDRLDRIAADIVDHFLGRGFLGKAMVVSIDKATALRMYDKVREHWDARLLAGRERLAHPESLAEVDRELLRQEIDLMETTDMAVVVSQSQNEIKDMAERGLDIRPHRERMVREDLETRFKDPADPLRLAFVCAMWTTGFDVPSCSTIYLDKPMRNHTLMQTIARANRVFPAKTNGLIVDYVGVFRSLQKALAIYAVGPTEGRTPVEDKSELIDLLRIAIEQAAAYCGRQGVDIDEMIVAEGFRLIELADAAVEKLVADDHVKTEFLGHARLIDRLFKAILPDPAANEFGPARAVFIHLAEKTRGLTEPPDISHVTGAVEELLDRSVAANAYIIRTPEEPDAAKHRIDLSRINFAALAARFAKSGTKHTEAERLRAAVAAKVAAMVRLNPTRIDWDERFRELIEEYNAGSHNVEEFFRRLLVFAEDLDEEERRGVAEGLDEEQLALYDLLLKPGPDLSDAERNQVKVAARSLLDVLKRKKLVLDWRKRQRARANVRVAVEKVLDEHLPRAYDKRTYTAKCDAVYQHIYDSYWDDGGSVYSAVA